MISPNHLSFCTLCGPSEKYEDEQNAKTSHGCRSEYPICVSQHLRYLTLVYIPKTVG